MPQGKDYIFCFQDKDYKFWRVDGTNVRLNTQPYFLEFSPVGWENMVIQNIRNKRYWGIDRSVTVSLGYVNDAAKILKYIFLNKGAEEQVYLTILEQQLDYDPLVGYKYWYKVRYRGEADLTTYSHEGSTVKCTTLEDGLAKYMRASENTVYEFPMDDSHAIYVQMDGIKLHEKLNYDDVPGYGYEKQNTGSNFFSDIIQASNEGEHTGLIESSQSLQAVASLTWDELVNQRNCLLWNTSDTVSITVNLKGRIEFTCTGMSSSPAYATKVRFLRTGQLIGNQNDYQVISTAAMVVGTTYSQDFDINIVLGPGERIYRETIFFGGSGSNAIIEFTEDSKFSMSFITRYQTTYIKAFRPQYLFNQFIDKVTEGNFTAKTADYFVTHSDKVFTCGNAIRGFSDAILKWSWSDFFDFWDKFDSVGISDESDGIDFAAKPDLIDDADIIELAEPSDLKVSLATDLCYNELEIGYPEIRNDVGVLNGNEEFNTKYLFTLGVMKKPTKLDKVSKISASCYSIEKIRVTTINKDTTDYKSDNEIFVLHIDNTPYEYGGLPSFIYYKLDRSLNSGITTGLIEPDTVFNIGLSPHLNLKRNGQELRSRLWLCDGKTLTYVSSDKNNKLIFAHPVYTEIVEKGNENLGGLGDKYITPIVFDITIPPPYNIIELLDQNPRKIYRFPFYGKNYTGIMLEVNTGMASHKAQEWKLLALPDNEFKNLIDYYG